MLWAEIRITCLISWLTMTKIVSNLEDNRSFLIRSFGNKELFEKSVGLMILWLGLYTSNIGHTELLYISIKAGLGISMAN